MPDRRTLRDRHRVRRQTRPAHHPKQKQEIYLQTLDDDEKLAVFMTDYIRGLYINKDTMEIDYDTYYCSGEMETERMPFADLIEEIR